MTPAGGRPPYATCDLRYAIRHPPPNLGNFVPGRVAYSMRYRFEDLLPEVQTSVFIAPGAAVIGDVRVEEDSSIWFGTVLRGDVNHIRVGARTNIQDQTMVHVSKDTYPTIIGDDVTIGHKAMVHGCTVGHRVLVGMGATILDGCEIGDECIIGAGTLLLERTKIPPRSLVVGSPGMVKRPLRDEEVERIVLSAKHYAEMGRRYREGALVRLDAEG
jgi:carbonic anhydrase/acetyltransferase-like protein (isoleucine patch superfamily)